MKAVTAVACMTLLVASAARAEDAAVYESLTGVDIGRVFYTQEQRRVLDTRRLDTEGYSVSRSSRSSHSARAEKDTDAAGYIIGSSGRSRVWKNGDFIDGTDEEVAEVTFPGDVDVQVHEDDDVNDK